MSCYLCGGEDLEIISNRLRSGLGKVEYCKTCQLGMLADKRDHLQDFYNTEYREKYGPDLNKTSNYKEIFEAYVNYQSRRVDAIKKLISCDSRLLEVGCSTGHFLYHIKNYVKEAIGVDYDSRAAEYASLRTGCITFGDDLLKCPIEKKSFDVVCAFQTLEHVDDPLAFMNALLQFLKPDGWAYIEVPNLLDPLLSIYKNPEYRDFYFREAHTFYFTPNSLTNLMARVGISGSIHFTQDYNIMNHLNWQLTHRPQPTCHEGLGNAHLPGVDGADEGTRQDLDAFMTRVDKEYKSILALHGLTDNISFIGQRRP